MTLKDAAHGLHAELTTPAYPSWLTGVGVRDTPGEPTIVVYVASRKAIAFVPETWEGFPVKRVVSGPMRLCSH
jgi:hypothetical protein